MRASLSSATVLAAGLAAAGLGLFGAAAHADPLVHTYSIVARDPATGEMGVAVQSHWFSVGSVVTWGRARVGTVATQSLADPAYGPRLLEALAKGEEPEAALQRLVADDPGGRFRQVACVRADGATAVHTGEAASRSPAIAPATASARRRT